MSINAPNHGTKRGTTLFDITEALMGPWNSPVHVKVKKRQNFTFFQFFLELQISTTSY